MAQRSNRHRRQLGEAIRAERLARDLTQELLAEKADLSVNFIGNVERGEQAVSLDSMVQIAAALKLSVQDLMAKARL